MLPGLPFGAYPALDFSAIFEVGDSAASCTAVSPSTGRPFGAEPERSWIAVAALPAHETLLIITPQRTMRTCRTDPLIEWSPFRFPNSAYRCLARPAARLRARAEPRPKRQT